MTPEIIGSIVRTLAATIGGILITKGIADESTVNQLVGGAVALATLAWSIWQKKTAKKTAKKTDA